MRRTHIYIQLTFAAVATTCDGQSYNVLGYDWSTSTFHVQNGNLQLTADLPYTGAAGLSRVVAAPGREELFVFGHSDGSSPVDSNPQILRIDPLTSSTELIATIPTTPWSGFLVTRTFTHAGIAYNEADNVIYTLTRTSEGTSDLATTDVTTGITTSVVELEHRSNSLGLGSILGLAFDNATGELFTLANEGFLEDDFVARVDPITGSLDSLFSLQRSDSQDLGINPATGSFVINPGARSLQSFTRDGDFDPNGVRWNSNAGDSNHAFAFVSTSVPTPSTAACLAAGLLGAYRRRR